MMKQISHVLVALAIAALFTTVQQEVLTECALAAWCHEVLFYEQLRNLTE